MISGAAYEVRTHVLNAPSATCFRLSFQDGLLASAVSDFPSDMQDQVFFSV